MKNLAKSVALSIALAAGVTATATATHTESAGIQTEKKNPVIENNEENVVMADNVAMRKFNMLPKPNPQPQLQPVLPSRSGESLTQFTPPPKPTPAPKPTVQPVHTSGKKGYYIDMVATAYNADQQSCGKDDGITASGTHVQQWRTVAVPSNIPLGTKLLITNMDDALDNAGISHPDLSNNVYVAEDRGGAITGNHMDVFMWSKADAIKFGRRNIRVFVITN